MRDDFYRAFEEKYRGSRELIKNRLRFYIPFVRPVSEFYPSKPVLDIGCGRGEWLELMLEQGFKPYGVDIDEGMLEACDQRNLPVGKGDAISFLSELPDESQAIISAFHVVEHINFDELHRLVSEALRVLKSGGLLIMETPNPENIIVATRSFYLDPTHNRPIPSELLSYLPEYYGYRRTKVVRLQEDVELAQSQTATLNQVLEGASPDYAVIAQKHASLDILSAFDTVFSREHGLTTSTLASRNNDVIMQKIQQAQAKAEQAQAKAEQAEAKAEQAEAKAEQAEAKAEQAEAAARATQAEARTAIARATEAEESLNQTVLAASRAITRAEQAEAMISSISNSYSWRATAPLRLLTKGVRHLFKGGLAFVSLGPGSPSRRFAKSRLLKIKNFIVVRPRLKKLVLSVLQLSPRLFYALERRFAQKSQVEMIPSKSINSNRPQLSIRAQQIHKDLQLAIKEAKEG